MNPVTITEWHRPATRPDDPEVDTVLAATIGDNPPDDSGGWRRGGTFSSSDLLADHWVWLDSHIA